MLDIFDVRQVDISLLFDLALGTGKFILANGLFIYSNKVSLRDVIFWELVDAHTSLMAWVLVFIFLVVRVTT